MSAELLEQMIQEAGLPSLTAEALNRFDCYVDLLLKWNARLNLTAIRDPETILRRHLVECIQCAQVLPKLTNPTLLDFGSGAGLPGIPIAVCRPDIHVTLAESQQKKSAFLREATRTLDLAAEVFDGRVESMPPARQFNMITLRAVDRMPEACKIAFPRVKLNGWIVAFSTRETAAEIKQALPFIKWLNETPSTGLDNGLLLTGQRSNQAL